MPKVDPLVRIGFAIFPHEAETLRHIGRHLSWKYGITRVPMVMIFRHAIQALAEREGLTADVSLNLLPTNHNNHDSK